MDSASRSSRPASVLAVLVLPDVVADAFGADMKHLLTRFGAVAGSALFNARRYEAAMFLLDTGRVSSGAPIARLRRPRGTRRRAR